MLLSERILPLAYMYVETYEMVLVIAVLRPPYKYQDQRGIRIKGSHRRIGFQSEAFLENDDFHTSVSDKSETARS